MARSPVPQVTQSLPEALYQNGFTDLVSIMPPGATLAPSSTIPQSHVGKIPGRRLPNGLWAGYAWQKAQHTLEDVQQWNVDGASVGLRAERFPAVDIDCLDPELAQIIEDHALAELGFAPIRVGRAPKRLLMYRAGEPFGRMRVTLVKDGVEHLVEVLGAGQQYVVHGVHPTTMLPYAWNQDMLSLTPDELPLVTRDSVAAWLDQLEVDLEKVGVVRATREGDGQIRKRTAQDGLAAPSLDVLRDAVRRIPNTNDLFPTRDDYIKVGYAVKAAGGADEDEAYEIFAEWAAKWEGNERSVQNDPDTIRSDWRRFRGPYSVGWGWLCEQARAFGFESAGLDFEVLGTPESERPLAATTYSDQWLADRVVERQRARLRFAPQLDRFFAWADGRWYPDAELLAEDIIKHELRRTADTVARSGTTPKEIAKALARAELICSAGKVGAVASLVKSDRAVAVSVTAFDHDPWLLNTPGGIVDLRTGGLNPADPDALCSKSTSVPPAPSASCPQWLRFLDEACGQDVGLIAYLQRLCGYALTGSTREQQLSFIFGPGGNGKSVFLNVLSGILGDYARTASMDAFTASRNERHTTEIAMLAGARLVTASETESGKRWDEPRVKQLTGGEPVSARFMRQDNFTFLPQFKLVFVGNHKPEVRDVDAAMRRRIQMVPFLVTPAVVDKELAAKLREEWPAILSWMIAGCLAWQQDGLRVPPVIEETTTEYFTDEDRVGRWLATCCVVDVDSTALSQDLYVSWREWANANGEPVGSLKRLVAALVTRRYQRWRDVATRKHGFVGLRVLDVDPLEAVT